jgi:tetratricopeptide (TPR) repeat protein/DNA-binding winged helix-turn-helix (wHTH) protein
VNPSSKQIFRFGDVEVDPAQGCLRRGGEELHLRQQTFQVMIYLLENRGRLVTKEELLANIWKETAVTDDALVQCVMDIRRAIGDDSRRPIFIKTLPKVGYRFVSPVEEHWSQPETTIEIPLTPNEATSMADGTEEVSRNHDKLSPAVPLVLPPATRPRIITRRVALIGVAVILVAAIIYSAAYLRQKLAGNAKPVTEVSLPQVPGKKPVAVMYFDNQSGSRDLDWLREGLADMIITDLSRSEKLSLLSRQQLHLLLERIGHNENEKIRLDEALDVARRSQAKIVVLGSFARLGEQIRIDVQLHDARDGQLLTAERLVVEYPAQLLTQVDLLSFKIASYLGAPAEQEESAGLTSVMTDNLAAYRYYTLGVEKANALLYVEAVSLLEKAVSLDPEFAMAHARIGYTYALSWARPDEAKPYLEKAFQLSDRLTEKDRLSINAWYAVAHQDYPAAIGTYRQIIARYPLEVEAYWRLARLLRGEERMEESVEIAKLGLAVDSEAKDIYNALGVTYMEMGRHDEAIAALRRYVELAPEDPNIYDSLGMAYQWAGRYAEAMQAFEKALSLNPRFEIAVLHLGNTYVWQGRYRDALRQYQRFIQVASFDASRARGYDSIAMLQLKRKEFDEAQHAARATIKHDKQFIDSLLLLALERGDLATADKQMTTLEARHSLDRGNRGYERKRSYLRGYLALKSGRTAEAVENFSEAVRHRPMEWYIDAFEDCLARGYLELGRLDEAIVEYERILRLNPNYPLAQYHLAQAYERQGKQDQARAAYERFLQIWKDADADLPEVITARQRFAG